MTEIVPRPEDSPAPDPGRGEAGEELPSITLNVGSGTPPLLEADSALEAGHLLGGRYRVVRRLGSGGMGTVYLAEHAYLGRLTAVKVLHRRLTGDQQAGERFRREALLAARIDHPSVAQIYDFDCTPAGEFLLAMEYIEGETLGLRIRRMGPMPLPQVARIVLLVAEGLDRAHSLGIVHRDIKPENIMLATAGGAKLLDFGIARPLDLRVNLTSQGLLVGTPAYMSPEQILARAVGPPSDIYSLGAVVYEMVTGQQAHSGTSLEELRGRHLREIPPRVVYRPECPGGLCEAIDRALKTDPRDRWPSAVEFARAVSAALSEPQSTPPPRGDDSLDRWEAHFEALRFAGREREMRRVREAWAAGRGGRTTVLWIEGEEGAGKSSFFEQAHRQAEVDGVTALVGRGYEAEGCRPYGPWLPVLRAALKLESSAGRPWPAIAALTGGAGAQPPERALLFEEVADLVRGAAVKGHLFLGLEDLDWFDPASLSLFEFLVQDLSGVPVLLAATVTSSAGSRSAAGRLRELRERLRRLDRVAWVSLKPLGYDAVADWLSFALGREAPEELVRFVYGHTEGNAFFIEQVLRASLERGELERLSDPSARLTYDPPPEAVVDVLARRLSGMSETAREILQIAAVVGREFDVDLLLALTTHSESAVMEALDGAEDGGVLACVDRKRGDWYRFSHVKIAQVLAQELNPRSRRKLHAQIAAALRERQGTAPGEIAWHLFRAGDLERAAEEALQAARHALLIHAYDDALTFGVMAAEAATTLEAKRPAHELRGDALSRLERHGEAAAAYAHARLAGSPEGPVGLSLRRKELHSALWAGSLSAAAGAAEAGRLVESAAGRPPEERAAMQVLLAEALLRSGEVADSLRAAETAEALAGGDAHTRGEALLSKAGALLRTGRPAEAERAARSAGEIFSATGDPNRGARALMLEGAAASERGDRPAAADIFASAMKEAERAQAARLQRQIREMQAALGKRPGEPGAAPPP